LLAGRMVRRQEEAGGGRRREGEKKGRWGME
jgi:hypothetical protein